MNYGWAFHSDSVILKKIQQGYNKEVAFEYREFSRQCLMKFCYFIKELALTENFNIIIRPHPSISVEQYIEVFNSCVEGVLEKIIITKNTL